MSGPLSSGIRGAFGILVNGTVILFILLLGFAGFFDWADVAVYDRYLDIKMIRSPLIQSDRILPIDLNDRAERNLGERLDSREAFADLFYILSEAEVLWGMELAAGMDIHFPRSRIPEMDQRMAHNASAMNGLVLAVIPMGLEESNFSGSQLAEDELRILRRHLWHPQVRNGGTIPQAATFLVSNRGLLENAAALGHIGMESPRDGIFRKVPLLYRWEDGFIPSLPLAMAAVHFRIDSSDIIIDAGKEVIIPHPDGHAIRIPIDSSAHAWIPFAALWETRRRVPLDAISDAVQDEDAMHDLIQNIFLNDSFILVGDTTTGQKDFGITAFDRIYPLVGIHENILNGILTGQFYRSTPAGIRLGILLASFALLCCAFYRKNDIVFHLMYAAVLCLQIATISILWFVFSMVPWLAVPVFAVVASWFLVFALRLLKARENRLLMTEAMSRYFPRSLAEKILAEQKTDLVPASKEVTILFADIKGFTNWSSEKQAETVHAFLSDYLESMASIIFACGGTVDKFLGDGILAFFGDPFEQPDHTDRCLRAAIAMQKKARELAVKWAPLVGIDLKIRVGINTGTVIVGNLGTKTRIEYTVIGATVNLAQRMESNAPVGGILVAPDAKAKASGEFNFSDPVAVDVKGYDVPIKAYVLMG